MTRLLIDEGTTSLALAYKLYRNSSTFREVLDQSFEISDSGGNENEWSQLLSSVGGTERSLGLHFLFGVETAEATTFPPIDQENFIITFIQQARAQFRTGGEGFKASAPQFVGDIANDIFSLGRVGDQIVALGFETLNSIRQDGGVSGRTLVQTFERVFNINKNAIGQLPIGEIVDFVVPLENVGQTVGQITRPLVNAANALRQNGRSTSAFTTFQSESDLQAALEGYATEAIENIADRNGIPSSVDISSAIGNELQVLQEQSGILIPWSLAQF